MLVPHRLVFMPMGVWLGCGPVVAMLVMVVMDMPVLVRERFVRMFVLMSFGEMQPKPQSHQQRRESQLGCQRLPETQGDQRANEWGQREVSASASGPEMTKGKHEKNKADSDHKETQQGSQGRKADGR